MPIALSLAAARLRTKGRIKFSLMNKIKAKAFLISISLVILVIASGCFYLTQVNTLATSGYEINNLKQQLQKIKEQNKQLELEASQLQSMQKISERVGMLGMTQIAYTEYLSSTGSSVAVR